MKCATIANRILPGFCAVISITLVPAALSLVTGCAGSLNSESRMADCCRNPAAAVSPASGTGSVGDIDALWETDAGTKIQLRQLNGRVRVISMFYATCQGVCVITKNDMQTIEASLSPAARERVGFVLVTLDPRRDTAADLGAYRRAEALSPGRWTLLRGDEAATKKLAGILHVGYGRDDSGQFVHSSELIVLDDSGRIIHQHGGLRADLAAITREIEAAALPKTGAPNRPLSSTSASGPPPPASIPASPSKVGS